jgi:beta-lactamase class A
MRIRLAAALLATLLVVALGGATASAQTSTAWVPNVAAARHYAKHRAGRVSFQVIDLAGRTYGFGARRGYPMASTIKVMLLVAYLNRPSVRNRRLHGSERALLSPMIRRSSNNAATRVRNIVGGGAINRVAHRAHMHRFHQAPAWGVSRTSPSDQARFMLNIEQLLPDRHRAFALGLLAHVVHPQRWGIGRVNLPAGWNLYFKGGWGTLRVNNQIALIESGSQRLALAIYTQNDDGHSYGTQTLQGVAARLLEGLPLPTSVP